MTAYDDARSLLTGLGLAPGEVLGHGAEGVAVALPGDRVAKVWHQPSLARARAAKATLDAVARSGLPFATPQVLEVLDPSDTGGVTVTIEAHLPGAQLGRAYADGDGDGEPLPVDAARVDHLVAVLAALASVEPTAAMSGLPVLPDEPPFAAGGDFAEQLAALVERRVAQARGPLMAAVPDLGPVTRATVRALGGLAPARPALVHGDLVPMNVHVEDGRVVAVLDLGFLTTAGDPAFDAAVTASIFDMYGPRHRDSEAILDEAFTTRLGHDPHRFAVHRAAYALATATVFSPDGSDGHFDWCVQMLRRDDVRAAIA
ncbi:phosphotransferase family protein [Nocardioides plantarum]|uniref:Phosphotransferase family protein n=1 Tax=Nocardioides plantarum TaxID=29299 RepID=A0ABV5K5W3_9ACTN|nr:phosphotransferase [Nocardioides plantarum]